MILLCGISISFVTSYPCVFTMIVEKVKHYSKRQNVPENTIENCWLRDVGPASFFWSLLVCVDL